MCTDAHVTPSNSMKEQQELQTMMASESRSKRRIYDRVILKRRYESILGAEDDGMRTVDLIVNNDDIFRNHDLTNKLMARSVGSMIEKLVQDGGNQELVSIFESLPSETRKAVFQSCDQGNPSNRHEEALYRFCELLTLLFREFLKAIGPMLSTLWVYMVLLNDRYDLSSLVYQFILSMAKRTMERVKRYGDLRQPK